MDLQRYAKEIAKTEAIWYLGKFYNDTMIHNKCPEKIITEHGYTNCDIINTSSTDPIWLARPIYGYAVPVVTLISLLTNSMAILILSNKTLRTPTNHILLTMATSELCTAFSSMPWVLYYYTFGGYLNDLKYGMPPFWCKYHSHIWKTIPTLFHTNAIWLTVYLAVQRYIYVCLSHSAQTYCTLKKTKITVWLIFLASVISVLPSLIFEDSISYEFQPGRYFCLKVYSELIEVMGVGNFMILSISARVIFVHVMPCIVIIIFTAKLFWAISKQEKKRSICMPTALKKLSTYSQSANQNTALLMTLQNKNNNSRLMQTSTRLLIVVISIFLIIEVPLAFIFMLHVIIVVYQVKADPFWNYINCLLIIRNFLIIFTYPINFAIYFGMSSSFKQIFKETFFGKYFKKKSISNNMTDLSSKNRKNGRSLANSHSACTPKLCHNQEICYDNNNKPKDNANIYLDVNGTYKKSPIKYRNSFRTDRRNKEYSSVQHEKRLSIPIVLQNDSNDDENIITILNNVPSSISMKAIVHQSI
uniref:G_PROTEIN_RECEP_F1_2 domain-containing protein n=1 Tax=Parastrongyloides trichosuri TaxID=131310 RepID=A0A0N4Z9L4_PARTI